ncbi:hypothetical protein [Actinoplanes rectilineatus]|uniref:hypothetical protein n=1 Tax=Actinoplanes rectilineatus TaxID=113571 RepID=UPI000AFC0385|nr:hypothetical protein [Actinoplanes rectilineatus]
MTSTQIDRHAADPAEAAPAKEPVNWDDVLPDQYVAAAEGWDYVTWQRIRAAADA